MIRTTQPEHNGVTTYQYIFIQCCPLPYIRIVFGIQKKLRTLKKAFILLLRRRMGAFYIKKINRWSTKWIYSSTTRAFPVVSLWHNSLLFFCVFSWWVSCSARTDWDWGSSMSLSSQHVVLKLEYAGTPWKIRLLLFSRSWIRNSIEYAHNGHVYIILLLLLHIFRWRGTIWL